MTARLFSFFWLLIVSVLSLQGQEVIIEQDDRMDKAIPSEPLVDYGEVFSNHPVQRTSLNQKLQRFAREDDFTVYFVSYSGVIGSDVSAKALEFRDQWLGSEVEGLVFVCDTDMKEMAYALTRFEGFSVTGKGKVWKLPDYEILEAMDALTRLSGEGMSEANYLSAIGNRLVDELDQRIHSAQEEPERSGMGYLLTFGVTAILVSLLAWWAHQQRAGRLDSLGAVFPKMKTSGRLGAQFGGGMVAEISFQPPSSENHS